MKAAILFNSKKPLIVKNIEIPDKLEFGQVLVKVEYSGICGAQINEIDAVKGKDKFLPHLLGHEGSGVVEKIGSGVTRFKKGDHVVMHWRKSSGIESSTPKYKYQNKIINAGWVTTFNEKAIVSENRLTKISKNLDLRIAPLFGCAITTAFGVISNDAKLKIGENILIFGLGGVGLNIVQGANMVSAGNIIGIDLHESKIKLARNFGLDKGYIFNSELKKKLIKKFPQGFDVVVETTGKSKIIEFAYELTNKDGRTILVGVPNKKVNLYTLPLHFKKVLKGSHGGNSVPDIDIPKYVNLLKKKKFRLSNLITHEFNLENINEALKLFRSGKAGRIIIKTS